MTESSIGSHVPTAVYNDPSAKFWSLYLSKSEKCDNALIQNWKGDMDSILIFAGLFSASVTAFIIESYKTLSPDPTGASLAILTRISQQLEQGTNAITLQPLPQIGNFSPTKSSLACNILWFLSLSFSLACALSATLVEQWARHYIHATDSKPHPQDRARISAFLFQGLKKHRVFAVVEAIPIFLHLSLFLFFAGLVFFLYPVNVIISFSVLGILVICCILYILVTFSPIIHLDSPYRTPASMLWWKALQTFRILKYTNATGDRVLFTGTITEAQEEQAVTISPSRDERDLKAMCWTINSLRTTHELEPFVEVIPNVVVGLDYSSKLLLHRLLHHEDIAIRLGYRIPQLLASCANGVLEDNVASKRAITCLAAIWSLMMMSIPTVGDTTYSPSPRSGLPFDENTLALVSTTQIRLPAASSVAKSTFLVVAQGLLDVQSGRARWFQDRLRALLDSERSCCMLSFTDEKRNMMWKNLHQLNRQQRLLAKAVVDRKSMSSTLTYGEMEGVAQHQTRLFSLITAIPREIYDVALVQEVLLSLEQFQCIVNQAGFSLALLYMEHVLEPTGKALYEPSNTIRRAFFRMNFNLPIAIESQQLLAVYLDRTLEQQSSGKTKMPRSIIDIMMSFAKALMDPVCVMKARGSVRKYLKTHDNDVAIQALEGLDARLEMKQPGMLDIFSSHMYADAKADVQMAQSGV
ncbi:hypothetical protein BDQ17DRAFT_861489 [Cyathus striatus]|nr:hypothetical protein BDQ17DRAFT_861489 [Cyathus striatus]